MLTAKQKLFLILLRCKEDCVRKYLLSVLLNAVAP